MKFYHIKIYFLAIILNIIPVFALIFSDRSLDERKLVGGSYIAIWLFIYLPFLFISQEKSKAKILFFLPSIFSIVILSIIHLTLNGLDMVFSLIILVPNLIFQIILFLYHSKKIRYNHLIKWFKLIFFTVFIISIGFVIPKLIANTISNDTLIQYVFVAALALIFFTFYSFYDRNKALVFQSPIIPRNILWVLPFFPILVSFMRPFPQFELNSFLKVLLICLSIGVAEETIFRGILFRLFQKTIFPIYLLASSILFGLLHTDSGISGVLSATIGGLIFGLARISGFPLFLLIICHAIFDIPSIWIKYGNVSNELFKSNTLFQIGFSILFIITLLITIIYLSIRKHWTNRLDISTECSKEPL